MSNDPNGAIPAESWRYAVRLLRQTLPGWDEHISDVRTYEDLPEKAQSYVHLIETATGVPVKWIGVGPEREATILR